MQHDYGSIPVPERQRRRQQRVWVAATLADKLLQRNGRVESQEQRPSGTGHRVVFLASFPGYLYCTSDQTAWSSGQQASCEQRVLDPTSTTFTVAGGTSFGAPIFAGMVAILNQMKGSAQGLVNQELYSLAASSSTYSSAFHDVASGSNACNSTTVAGGGSTTYCPGSSGSRPVLDTISSRASARSTWAIWWLRGPRRTRRPQWRRRRQSARPPTRPPSVRATPSRSRSRLIPARRLPQVRSTCPSTVARLPATH